MKVPLPGVIGESICGTGGVGLLLECSKAGGGGAPSEVGFSCEMEWCLCATGLPLPLFGLVVPCCVGLAGLIWIGLWCSGLLHPGGAATFSAARVSPGGIWPAAASVSGVMRPIRLAFLVDRLVGRRVQRRLRPAQRLHGNFLSHLVFVLAQLLQAIGVRPADFGIMPLLGGKPSWLFWSRPWTV